MANRGMAKVQLIGNLGKDPEVRYSQSGTETTRFSLACGRVSRGADGNQVEETDWFNCTAFGNQGKVIVDYLKKGSRVYIEGRLQIRQYDDKDGVRRTSADVIVNDVQLIDSRRDNNSEAGYSGGGGSQDSNDDDDAAPPQPARRPNQAAPAQQSQGRRPQPARSTYEEDAEDIPF